MTKDEYAELLDSDYWKGYSYSIIKERNFTCEDCGRKFLNERNKLQVHHLVYRDVNPWSYKPEELVVLCRECHEKRHGIYSGHSNIAKVYYSVTNFISSSFSKSKTVRQFKKKLKKAFYFTVAILIVFLVMKVYVYMSKTTKENVEDNNVESIVTPEVDTRQGDANYKRSKSRASESSVNANSADVDCSTDVAIEETPKPESLDVNDHDKVAEKAASMGLSTEGSTSDILDRINNAEIIERAKKYGVSTEGSALEILARIDHASAVQTAKNLGLSTEGTTNEICERIKKKINEDLAK